MRVPKLALLLLTAFLLTGALAGCIGGPSEGSQDGGDGEADGNGDDGEAARRARLSASVTTGPAPLDVTFNYTTGDIPNVTGWSLRFGDDNETQGDGDDLPGTSQHTFTTSGVYPVTFSVTYENGAEQSDVLTIVAAEPPGPPPIRRKHNGSAIAGLPHPGRLVEDVQPLPEPVPGAGDVAKAAYDNGANGTTVIGYELNLSEGYRTMLAFSFAPLVDPMVPLPDYDLFLYDPDGELAASSQQNMTFELVQVNQPAAGTWSVIVAFWAGADHPVDPQFAVTTMLVAI